MYINNIDITKDINIINIEYIDSCDGYNCDSIIINLANTQDQWQQWGLEINSKIKIESNAINTGVLFVDDLVLFDGGFTIYGKSTPLEIKSDKLKVWEGINLDTIFQEKANKYKLQIEKYGIQNYKYKRIEQINETDIQLLTRLSTQEGYTIKIYDNKIIIINDEFIKSQAPIKTIKRNEIFNEFDVIISQDGLLKSVIINTTEYGNIKHEEANIIGDTKVIYNKYISDYAEGLRFAKALVNKNNLNYMQANIMIQGDTDLYAGCNINLVDFGEYDGLYTIQKITNKLDDNYFMILNIRRIIK